MRDESQKIWLKEWVQQNAPLIWVEMIYEGDVRQLPKLIGFKFGGHYFESHNQTTIFYINKQIKLKAKNFGTRKYKNILFLKNLIRQTKIAEKNLLLVIKIIKQKKLDKFNNQEIWYLFSRYFKVYTKFIGLYRFTRPTFYEELIQQFQSQLPVPKRKNINFLLNNDFKALNFTPDKKIVQLAKALKKVGDRRFVMHRIYLTAFADSQKLFCQIARRLKMTSQIAQNCTYEELKKALFKQKYPANREIKNRINYFKFVYHNDFFEIITGKPKIKQNRLSDNTPIRGQVANPGLARGRVKVVKEKLSGLNLKDLSKVQKGDILVATSTSPDMMTAIKKVAAIVTDVGGLLSHAAIVSRELNIPCIVGTNIATRILKDGDIIEVDAQKGFIQKQ